MACCAISKAAIHADRGLGDLPIRHPPPKRCRISGHGRRGTLCNDYHFEDS